MTTTPSKVDCSNLYCPQAIAYRRREGGAIRFSPADMSKDANDHYWCQSPECQKRYELLQWGAVHRWPEVKAGTDKGALLPTSYAIAGDEESWKVAIMLGNDEAIEAYYGTLIAPVIEDEQEGQAS